MNALAVIQLINLLVGMSITSLEAVRRFQSVVEKARAEGRDISDEELADLAAETKRMKDQTLDLLTGGA